MAQHPQKPEIIRVADLSPKRPSVFDLAPNAEEMERIADGLDLLGLRKLRFRGEIRAEGRKDWLLQADLGATVTQPCVVTLDPVSTRIDTAVTRRFTPEHETMIEDAGGEIEMPEDDTQEPLPREIDLRRVMIEALALALPDWPRSEGAELGEMSVTESGAEPIRDEEVKPFAALAGLRDKLKKDD
ncbi:DUF177 domain-containing protein [uncultured Roseovarius sp.]|uniref:YceD family protein n=1 Tax=uncultured Roseovarius sp. TaxID=293344 RepID=UPI00262E8FA4|nr:DUF177 domain-containing protein [uncultured Roseovarius sp.]